MDLHDTISLDPWLAYRAAVGALARLKQVSHSPQNSKHDGDINGDGSFFQNFVALFSMLLLYTAICFAKSFVPIFVKAS